MIASKHILPDYHTSTTLYNDTLVPPLQALQCGGHEDRDEPHGNGGRRSPHPGAAQNRDSHGDKNRGYAYGLEDEFRKCEETHRSRSIAVEGNAKLCPVPREQGWGFPMPFCVVFSHSNPNVSLHTFPPSVIDEGVGNLAAPGVRACTLPQEQ